MQRPFTSGSRQAPDPFDQFLEDNSFFRKHTARDSSCLFRVISEQLYDTQLHHSIVRKQCVRYMRAHHWIFAKQLGRDLDEYLDDMSKSKTYGTLLELQAASYLFQRNVLLFEPFSLGNYFTNCSKYTEVFRVFYSPERHFDSVFTSDFIKDAAICQSICYEILYKDLFKLPDVTFAVEQMLHSQSLESTEYTTEYDENGYCRRINLKDGRFFEFDLPNKTLCILANYKLCHFHYPNFPRFSEELRRDLKILKPDENSDQRSFLPEKFVSCVRQLLLEGITPFPYKVAKALDPNMYRNIEFDAWNEARKEINLQNWYTGDYNFKLVRIRQKKIYQKVFQVGAKCHVKLCKSDPNLYTCHIQEIAVDKGYCVVFIEQLGEKRLVSYDCLQPLPVDQFKPWGLPYRLQRHIHRGASFRYTRQQYNYQFKLNEHFLAKRNDYFKDVDYLDFDDNVKYKPCHQNEYFYKLKQYTHLENFETQTVEYCTMPATVEHVRSDISEKKTSLNETPAPVGLPDSTNSVSRFSDGESQRRDSEASGTIDDAINSAPIENLDINDNISYVPPELHYFYQQNMYPEEFYGYDCDSSIIPSAGPPVTTMVPPNGAQLFYVCNGISYPYSFVHVSPSTPSVGHPQGAPSQIIAPGTNHLTGYYPTQYYSPPLLPITATADTNGSPIPTYRHVKGLLSNTPGRINYDAKKSVKSNGIDLPRDVATLRYFFNLGLEYHKHLRSVGTPFDKNESIVNIKLEENVNHKGIQIETNKNKTLTSSSVMSSTTTANINYSSNKSHKRFPSRYFNSKERQSYQRGQQQNRSNQTDYGNKKGSGDNYRMSANAFDGNGAKNQATTPNTNRVNENCENNEGKRINHFSEQGNQTSPMIFYEHSDANIGDLSQPSYNSNQNVMSYVQDELNGGVSLVTPNSTAGGLYIPMTLPPPHYGIYSGPPPPPPQAVPGYPYMSPTSVPTFYPAPKCDGNSGVIDAGINAGFMDLQTGTPQQYPIIGYPPPQMQYIYSPTSGGTVGTSSSSTSIITHPQSSSSTTNQGYCSVPPQQQLSSSNPLNAVPHFSSIATSSNRRETQKNNEH